MSVMTPLKKRESGEHVLSPRCTSAASLSLPILPLQPLTIQRNSSTSF